jgi:hypothetical protein
MIQIPERKSVLFAFSDPGGAKGILALAQKYKNKGKIRVISNRSYSFFNEFKVQVHHSTSLDLPKIMEAHYDLVITGTSYTTNFENKLIEISKNKGIEVWSFIDHWAKMKARFVLDGSTIFPDRVLVIDGKAQQIAVNEDIPESIIKNIGHPYHQFLSEYSPRISQHQFQKELNISDNSINLLFAPDPLSNVREMNDWINTDEYEILEQINDALAQKSLKNINLLIKAHPNQDVETLKKRIDELGSVLNIVLVNDLIALNDLIYYCSFTISMFSNILKESTLIGTPVIRILTNIKHDPLNGFQKEQVISDSQKFSERLNKLISEKIT